jgi:hypothetical protein
VLCEGLPLVVEVEEVVVVVEVQVEGLQLLLGQQL